MPRKSTPTEDPTEAPTETLPRIDLPEDFSDVDGDLNTEFGLRGEDPDRHYVWVHNDPRSIGEYKGNVLRYQMESAAPDGVRPQLDPGLEDGEAVTKMDHVLMSCSRQLWEKRQRYERMQDAQTRGQMIKRARSGSTVMRRGDDGRWSGAQAGGED